MLLPSLTNTFKTNNPLNPSVPLPSLYSLHDSSVQFSHSAVSNSLLPHGLQHTRPPCPSTTPRVYSNSCPLSQWFNHLILCRPLLLLPSIFPSIRIFSNESVLHIRWPKFWSFSFNINPSNEYSGLISFRMDWLDLLAVQGTLKSLLHHHSSWHLLSKSVLLMHLLDYCLFSLLKWKLQEGKMFVLFIQCLEQCMEQSRCSVFIHGEEKRK